MRFFQRVTTNFRMTQGAVDFDMTSVINESRKVRNFETFRQRFKYSGVRYYGTFIFQPRYDSQK